MKELFFESLDSTNSYLKRNYAQLDDLTFVRAAYQEKGRGRNGRKWLSKSGDSLMFSLLIKDEELFDNYKALSVLSAYSVLKVLEDYGLKDLSIKWPNDVYVSDKKICGILLEAVSTTKIECLIIGIGLNVKQKSFEGDYRQKPVSVEMLVDEEIDSEELRKKLYFELLKNIERLKDGEDLYSAISEYDYLKGSEAYASIDGNKKSVKVLGMDNDYTLKVKDGERILSLNSDEISFHI
ncbi:MAG: biotin--[Erysipelotrichaceae bacterium]|nr:biotin--[acetyl-CoA-carboxylase] ligase [Erysipelotrichaceae bacterium]